MDVQIVLVVDVANVVGSRPDGWWRDRRGAAERLLTLLSGLAGREVRLPDGRPATCTEVLAVVEGQARTAQAPPEVTVRRAAGEGDLDIVAAAADLRARGADVVVVTADRGLRQRLAPDVGVTGPGWLNGLIGR